MIACEMISSLDSESFRLSINKDSFILEFKLVNEDPLILWTILRTSESLTSLFIPLDSNI